MYKLTILIADNCPEFKDAVFSYYSNKHSFLMLTPPSFDYLLNENLPNFSIAIINSGFSSDRGLEALKWIKTSKPLLPVIFTSSKGTEELCLKAFKLGARDCFIAPFALTDLTKSIDIISGVKNEENNGNRSNLLLEKYKDSFSYETISLKKNHPGVEKAKRFIEKSIEEKTKKGVSIDDIVKAANMSKFHFCRIFKKQTGMTCSEYVNFARVNEAKELLKNHQLSIKEICFRIGFNNEAYFSRIFKNIECVSPLVYRSNLPSF